MNVNKIVQSEFRNQVERYILEGRRGIVYGITDTPYVQVHSKCQVDECVCNDRGYYIYELFHDGNSIVLNPGDILIGHFDTPENGWNTRFNEYLAERLREKGLDSIASGNDILVDGYKVGAHCVTRYGYIDYTGVFIGVNTHLDDIKAICKKPMTKVPRGLADYGITTEEVESIILDFFKES